MIILLHPHHLQQNKPIPICYLLLLLLFRFVNTQDSGDYAPLVKASASPIYGKAPVTVQFSSDQTIDPEDRYYCYYCNGWG